jgi:hypothetical protein
MKKHDQPALVYFNNIKTLADTLSCIGEPLCDSKFTGYILKGLDGEYDFRVEAVANNGGMPPCELYNRLLSIEQGVEARRVSDIYTTESFAHATSCGGGGYLAVAPACTPATPTSSGARPSLLAAHGQPCVPSSTGAPAAPLVAMVGLDPSASSAASLDILHLGVTSASTVSSSVLAMMVVITNVMLPWRLCKATLRLIMSIQLGILTVPPSTI